MRPWRRFGARSSGRRSPKAPNGRRTESEENSLNLSKLITTGAGSTALWGTNHLWNSKTPTTNNGRTDSTKLGPKNGGKGTLMQSGSALRCATALQNLAEPRARYDG